MLFNTAMFGQQRKSPSETIPISEDLKEKLRKATVHCLTATKLPVNYIISYCDNFITVMQVPPVKDIMRRLKGFYGSKGIPK